MDVEVETAPTEVVVHLAGEIDAAQCQSSRGECQPNDYHPAAMRRAIVWAILVASASENPPK